MFDESFGNVKGAPEVLKIVSNLVEVQNASEPFRIFFFFFKETICFFTQPEAFRLTKRLLSNNYKQITGEDVTRCAQKS